MFGYATYRELIYQCQSVAKMRRPQDTRYVRKILNRIEIATIVIAIAAMCWFGLRRNEGNHATYGQQPTDGAIKEDVYTNNFFKFTIQFPSGWKVLSTGSGPELSAKAASLMLLLVGSADKQMYGNRWIMIAAAYPPAGSPPFRFTADGLAKSEADLLNDELAMAPDTGRKLGPVPLGKPFETTIGGKRLVRLDISAHSNVEGKDYDVVTSQLATIERGYLILLYFSDPKGQESESEAARKAMNSLHFFGPPGST
jgi:hypothetical protein